MHDISLQVSELPIMGNMENDDYLQEHLPAWDKEVISKLEVIGYPVPMWPTDMKDKAGFIRHWKGTGLPRKIAPMNAQLDKTPYEGPKLHELVQRTFEQSFAVATVAHFCITSNEDWWPYEKTFICDNAQSYMMYILYICSVPLQRLLEAPEEKKRGRPRIEKADPVRSEKSERYQQWLTDCEEYRTRSVELKKAYMDAMKEYTDWKERGAPKWTI